jgi:hypothetical protein
MIFSRDEIAAALPGYELDRELGRGGYAVVFGARERATGRPVAVKVLVSGASDEDAAEVEDARRRFRDEAEILMGLRHPHLVEVHRHVEGARIDAIVMELLDGGDLHDRRRRQLDLADSCAVVLAAAQALGHAHRAGVLHRDVKPHNILFTADGTPKVSDFGIAKVIDTSMAMPSAVIGTPRYMAPEQFDLRPVGRATDLYALGVVAYELLDGKPPFDERSGHSALIHQHLAVDPPPPRGVPAGLAAVVLRALRKDPRDRQPSMRAFALEFATAATAELGPGWPGRAAVHVVLDDELRGATTAEPRIEVPTLAQTRVAVPAPTVPHLGDSRPATRGWVTPTGERPAPAAPPGRWAQDDLASAPPPGGPTATGGPAHRPPDQRHRGWAVLVAAAVVLAVVSGALALTLEHWRGRGGPTAGMNTTPPGGLVPGDPGPTMGPGGAAGPAAFPQDSAVPTTPPVTYPPVVVLNDSSVKTLGELARVRVENAGFTVARVAPYAGSLTLTTTTLYYGKGEAAAAQTLAARVPGIADVEPFSAVTSNARIAEAGRLVLVLTRGFTAAGQ